MNGLGSTCRRPPHTQFGRLGEQEQAGSVLALSWCDHLRPPALLRGDAPYQSVEGTASELWQGQLKVGGCFGSAAAKRTDPAQGVRA
jgi:hypothetical protein